MKRFSALFVAPTLLVILASVWPLVTGSHTLFLRDVFNTHLEMKWMQAESMREGVMPLVDSIRSGGQAHVGNPNTVPLYPDNLLYLFLPFFWVFNFHFWIHLFIAPLAMFWLAREWGIRREAAWASGAVYATCGYMLSNFNFYNLVAGVALAPALAAALLRTSKDRGRHWGFAAAAILWCLVLLGGDPIVAVLAALFGGVSMLALGERPGRLRDGLFVGLLGTVLAAPQLVEFLRVLPLTYRGLFGFSSESTLMMSWNPQTVLDWILPVPYGGPTFDFWGLHLFGGKPPLYYTLYPGALAVLWLLWSGWPRTRPARWAWVWMAAGVIFALGSFNPLLAWVVDTTGLKLARFPVKLWLLVALGGSLLSGIGVERWLTGDERDTQDRKRWGSVAVAAIGFWLFFIWLRVFDHSAVSQLRRLIPERFDAGFVEAERLRWAGLALILALLLTIAATLIGLGPRVGPKSSILAVLVVLHAGSQLYLLQSLLPIDEVAFYKERHAVVDEIPPGSRVVHGPSESLFGPSSIDPSLYPDSTFVWLQRRTFEELYPTAGFLQGLRYELKMSPEGLDSYRTRAVISALKQMPDELRVKLLEHWGVEYLILDREFEPPFSDRLEKVAEFPGDFEVPWSVYRFLDPIPEARFVGRLDPAPSFFSELQGMADPNHDPTGVAIVPPDTERHFAPAGSLEVVASGPESWSGRVRSSGGGAVVLQRTNLPIYRARVSGEIVEILDADFHRLAIPVPAGEHEVTLEVDRRPWRFAWIVALLAALELALVVRRMRFA